MLPNKMLTGLLTATLLAGCAAPRVAVYQTYPPVVSAMAGVKTIAIVREDDDKKDNMLSRLESSLSDVQVNGKQHFNLVDRGMIERVISEQKFSNSDLASSNTRVKLGRLTGADTIISARTIVTFPETQTFQETRESCDKDNNCKKIKVHCKKKVANIQFMPKAVSVERGKIIFSKTYTVKEDSRACSDEKSTELRSNFEMQDSGISHVLATFISEITPLRKKLHIALLEGDDDKNLAKPLQELVDSGNEFAKQGLMDKACQLYADAQSQNAGSSVINYNNGVCAEYRSDFETAIAFYRSAETKSMDPDVISKVVAAIKRVRSRQEANKNLKKYI